MVINSCFGPFSFFVSSLSFVGHRLVRGTKVSPVVLFILFVVLLECCGARLALAAPEPSVSLGVPDQPFLGENTTIEITFDNLSSSDVGYGPFVDVVLPVNGADGAAGTQEPDGVDVRGDATYLGTTVTTIVQTFPDDGGGTGCVDHPLAVDASKNPLRVCGTAGDKLVTVQLPFGSFVPDQPPATVELPVSISPKADLGHGLDVTARAGFMFGADPADNPDSDPPILSDNDTDSSAWTVSSQIDPILIRIDKEFHGSEDETVTGPNFPRRYRLNVRLAPGQTVTNLEVIDSLPSNMAFKEITDVSPSGYTLVHSPPADVASNPPDNQLDVQFSSVDGDSDPESVDAYVEFEYFIPLKDADSSSVLDPSTGDDVESQNEASAQGDWTPVDSRDPAGQDNAVADNAGPEHVLTDKAIAIQKSVTIVTDNGATGYSPGDVVEYTLDFQVSDYFSFDDVNVTDVLSDGQDFDTSFTPVLTINMDGNSSSADFDSANYSHNTNGDGTETLTFNVSAELDARLGSPKLVGGCIPDSGTGAGNEPDCSTYNDGPTTARIVFRAVVQEDFSTNYPSGDSSVDQGDRLDDNATVSGDILSTEDNNSKTGNSESDGSSAGFNIENGTVSKSLYAINGSTTLPDPLLIRPGDTVTYRIVFTMPTPDVEDLRFKDYLPLPVFDATEITSFDDTVSGDTPAAGTAKYGPDDTFHAVYDDGSGNDYPSISTDGAENSVEFIYGDFDSTDTEPRQVDILFTVTVKDDPFADGLFLTNMVRAHNGSTNAEAVVSDGIVQIELGEPKLNITKGVSASDNPAAVIDPSPSQEPINGDASNCDGNDTITFVITVENTGRASAYDVTIKDDTNLDMDNCTLVSVKDGEDNNLSYSGDLFGAGIVLDNPLPENDGSPGPPYSTDTALVIFTCKIKEDAKPTDVIDRQASTQWAAGSGAEKYPEETDNATVSMSQPNMSKAVSSVSPGPITPNMTIGDTVTYKVDVTLPEGTVPGVVLTDTLPAGLQYVDDSLSVNTDNFNGSFSQNATVSVSGQTLTIDMGDANVTADNDGTNNSFYLTFQAIVLDDPANSATDALQEKENVVELTYTGYSGTPITGTATNYLGEPFLQVTKTITPSPADAGDQVTVEISVENTGTSPAFDMVITDNLDGNVFDLNSVTEGTTDGNFTFDYSSPTVTYTADAGFALDPNDTVSFSFLAYVLSDVVTGSDYLNTASVSYSSESGDVSGERGGSESGNDTLQISSISLSKVLDSTSEPSTQDPYVAVGEVATFVVTYNIPEGLSKGVKLQDIMDKVSSTDWGQFVPGSVEILKSSDSLNCSGQFCTDVLNGSSSNQWLAVDDSYVEVTNSTSQTILSLDIGDANNTDTDNGNTEFYQLRFKIQVLNNAVTTVGTSLPDKGAVTYEDANGNINTMDTPAVSLVVAEPSPYISKSASPSTANGGDTINFTLNICNNGSGDTAAPAFDWNFSDVLPDKYENISGPTIDTGSTGASVSASFSGNTLSGTIDQLDPGECVQLTYSADLSSSVQYSEEITNTASFTTTSLPGDHGTSDATSGDPGAETGERTGSGSVNDLAGSSSATVTVSQPSLAKALLDPKDWYPVGENATFSITTGVPTGTSKDFVITDHLPSGLEFVPGTLVVTVPSNTSSTNEPLEETNSAFFTYDSATGTMTLDFGNVTVENSGDLTIQYKAVVKNVSGNQDGTVLSNSAYLSYQDPADPNNSITVGPSTTADVVHVGEPNLEMSKVITAGATGSDAGDTVSWQLEIRNTGHTTAYQVDWKDVLPDGLYNISNGHLSITGSVYLNGTTTAPADSDITIETTVNTNDTISLPALEIAPGGSVTVEFDSVLMDKVSAGETLNNQTAATYTSLVDGGRDSSSGPNVDDDDDSDLNNYRESVSQGLTVASDIAIDKRADKDRLVIGDTVRFTIRVDIVEGTTSALTVHDILPDGLSYVSHSVTVGNSNISFGNPDYSVNIGSGQEVVLDFGDVSNGSDGSNANDFIEVEIVARADNIQANQDGVILRNGEGTEGYDVYLTYDSGGASQRVDFDNDPSAPGNQGVPVEIIEPQLDISKQASPTSQSLGDVVTYTVTVTHTSQSSADAQELVMTDDIPVGLTYLDSSLPSSDVTVNGQTVTFRINSLTLSQGQTSFTYRARVDLDAPVDQSLTNVIHLTWKSLATATGETDSGRTGRDCTAGVNDYCDDTSSSVVPTASAPVDASKTVRIVDDRDGSGDATSGDILEYRIVVTNGSSDLTGTVFTDAIPENTSYVPGSLTLDSVSLTDGADSDQGDFGHTVTNGVTVRIGDMAANQVNIITFRVRVDDSIPAGVVISNQGVVDSDQSVPEPTDADGIDSNGDQPTDITVGGGVEPGLRAEKRVSLSDDSVDPTDGTINVGDSITYTILLRNIGGTVLHNVTFTDTVPSGVTITSVTNGQWTSPSDTVTAQFASIDVGDSQTITVTGRVDQAGTMTNQGSVSSDEIAQVLTDGDPDVTNGEQPTSFVAVENGEAGSPSLDMTKEIQQIGDTNKDGLINPGETFRYQLVLSNEGSSPATGVVIDDQIPDHLTVVSGSVHASKGAVVSESPVKVNVGSLNVGDAVTVYFDVTVDSDTPIGTVISNQAEATDDTGNTVLSDDSGTDDGRDCTGSALNCNDGDTGNDDPTEVVISGAHVFDPPSAYKSGTLGDKNIITWRQVWINNGNAEAINVRIIDPIPEHTSYVQGSLVCTPTGSSSTVRCEYDVQANEIIWEGNIGADLGASNEDEAQNEVIIEFKTVVDEFAPYIQNRTTGYWDRDGDGFIDDDIRSGQVAISSDARVPLVVTVPTLSDFGTLVLALAIFLAAVIARKGREKIT